MNNASSFKDQISRAQKTVDGWSASQKSSLKLEGRDIFQPPITKGNSNIGTTFQASISKQADPVS